MGQYSGKDGCEERGLQFTADPALVPDSCDVNKTRERIGPRGFFFFFLAGALSPVNHRGLHQG